MKTLKLTGLDSYSGVKTKGKVIAKGEVITVDDADAAYMTREENSEVVGAILTPHWSVVANGSEKVTHHFVSAKAEAEASEDKEEVAEVVAPKATSRTTQRKPRAAVAA